MKNLASLMDFKYALKIVR